MMDPQALIDSTVSSGLPAPFWLIQVLKVLGFTLHMVPMNLWYAGLAVALLLQWRGGQQAKQFSARLMAQMPVLVACGINFGIVPLLFLQTAYCKVFYPATILMAWSWLAIVVLLIPAYYGVYIYASGLRDVQGAMTPLRRAAGWCSAALFIVIGFLFANGLSLTTRVQAWPELWKNHSIAGAALGTALNLSDPALWPRWLLMFGLALGTTAGWVVVDGAWFGDRKSQQYRRWAHQFAVQLYSASLLWVFVTGSWYVLGSWPAALRSGMFGWPNVILTLATAAAPVLPLALLLRWRQTAITRAMASLLVLAQLGVLAINAVSRQVVQNLELRDLLDVAAQRTDVQWSPLVVFLLLFAAGLVVVGWMVAQVIKWEMSHEVQH